MASLGLNAWDVHSIETVVAGGDGLQEVVGDKATALKETRAPDLADCCTK